METYAYWIIAAGTVVGALAMIQIKMKLDEREWRKRAVRKKDKIKL